MLSVEVDCHTVQDFFFPPPLHYLQFLRSTEKEVIQKLLAYPRVVCKGTHVPFQKSYPFFSVMAAIYGGCLHSESFVVHAHLWPFPKFVTKMIQKVNSE